jgi:hypothetical protein
MKNIYLVISISFLLVSCSTTVQYIGASKSPTTNVEVFTSRETIQASYKEMGRGFIKYRYAGTKNPEKIQEKIVALAKKKGADAVLIESYYIPNTGAAINSFYRTDSVGKAAVTIGTSSVNQLGTSGFNILFLKYQ